MVLEDWARLVYIYYVREKRYWFTLEDFAIWVWRHSNRVSIYTIESNLEKLVKTGVLRKVYAKYVNAYGLPIKRRRYMIILSELKRIIGFR